MSRESTVPQCAGPAAFDAWAPIYDRVHLGQPGDIDFYQRFAAPGRNVLVLGAGTGRVAIPLSGAGARVSALDQSEGMLARSREKCERALGLNHTLDHIRADMTRFELGRRYDSILMPYRSFMHLHRQEDQRSCLRNVALHLKPGGLAIMTTWTPSARAIAARGPLARMREGTVTPDGDALRHRVSVSYDEERQRIVEEHTVFEITNDGAAVELAQLPLVRTWTSRRELLNLFSVCSLEVCALFGDFNGGAPAGASGDYVWILKGPRD